MEMGNLLLGLTGPAGCGKDTVANILVEQHGFKRIAFADALRKMAYDINPMIAWNSMDEPTYYADMIDLHGYEWTKRSYKEARRFLQKLGTEGIRGNVKDTYWVDVVEEILSNDSEVRYVVTDVRFPNEAKMVREMEGVVVHISRPGLQKLEGNHISENGVEFIPNADWSLLNTDLADLPMAVNLLLTHLEDA